MSGLVSSIYLVNVGANTKDAAKSRSPIFADGSWLFVSFRDPKRREPPGYSAEQRRFVRGVDPLETHADPDWFHLTYGDRCRNPRGRALMGTTRGDILLFWGLLWENSGTDWAGFTNRRGWYLLGALQVEEIVEPGRSLESVSAANRERAAANAHLAAGRVPEGERVFLGDRSRSKRFDTPIDLGVSDPAGLVYRAFTSRGGQRLRFGGKPRWYSSLRSCRKLWDLADPTGRGQAMAVRDAVLAQAQFDLLAHAP